MSKYEQRVKENLAHMGTPARDWRAVEITGTQNANGRAMPTFRFPKGYKRNETTLYKATSAESMNCELCGAAIKYAYWLQNDAAKELLLVGSECVTHFEEASGERLSKEAQWAKNRALLAKARRLADEMYRTSKGDWEAHKDWLNFYEPFENIPEDAPNGRITRWVNRHANSPFGRRIFEQYGHLLEEEEN